MEFLAGSFGEIVFKAGDVPYDECYEAQIEVAGRPVSVELAWQGDETDSLREALAAVAKRLTAVLEAGRAALAADLANAAAEDGVAMYAEHHSDVMGAEELAAAVGSFAPTKQDFLAHLRAYTLRVESERVNGRIEFSYELDYGIGFDVTNYLVCVRLDAELGVREVVVES